jgi:hypothetical protein
MRILLALICVFIALAVLSPPAWAFGGDSVGNGGVIWACRSGVGGRDFHAGVLTDLFEAKEQYGWPMIQDPGGDPLVAYAQRKAWLERELPELHAALKPRFDYVEQHRTFVNAELISTRDFNNAIKPLPSTCAQGEWSPLNMANFREEDQQVLISSELWQSQRLSTLDKAALLFHEAVYYWMRTYFGATDSDQARKITGVLFSSLPTEQIKTEIGKVVGGYPNQPDGRFLCVMKNSKRNQIYVAYENDPDEATLKVRMRCQNDADAMWCERSSIACEEISSEEHHRCVAENASTRKIFTGKGRSVLEAEFNAHIACYIGSQAQGGLAQQCPDFEFMECD